MIIGILSDTHDNLPRIEKGVKFFNRKRTEFVFHAGDFVAPFTIDKLNGLKCEWLGVFGNNDGERTGLKLKSLGRIRKPPLRIRLSGRRITVIHDRNTLDLGREKADIIISGHSHKAGISRVAGKLLVNPGECSGWLSGRSTVALLDTDKLSARIFKI